MSEISPRGASSIEAHDSIGTVDTIIVVARFSIAGVDKLWVTSEGVRTVLLVGLFNPVSDFVSLRLGQWTLESVEHLKLLWLVVKLAVFKSEIQNDTIEACVSG